VPKSAFLIHCGDFCVNGNENQINDFLNWFSKAPAKHKILFTGKHDFPFVLETFSVYKNKLNTTQFVVMFVYLCQK
jgi:hypothetical protein